MKRQVRVCVFETNSSSTHSLTVFSPEQYKQWQEGKVLFNKYTKEFKTPEEVKEAEYPDDFVSEEMYIDNLCDYGFELINETVITPGGEEIILFGHHGYNG